MNDELARYQAYLDQELPAHEEREVETFLLSAPAEQDKLAQLRDQRLFVSSLMEELERDTPQPLVASEQLQQFYARRKQTRPSLPAQRPWWQPLLSWPTWLAAPVAAAFLLLAWQPQHNVAPLTQPANTYQTGPTRHHPKHGILRSKGLQLASTFRIMYRPGQTNTPTHIQLAKPGQPLAPGDLIQFRYQLTKPAYGMIVGLNDKGEVFPYVPFKGTKSMHLQARQHKPGILPMLSSLELDNTLGYERFFLVVSPKPFAFTTLKQTLLRSWRQHKGHLLKIQTLSSGQQQWQFSSWLIHKRQLPSPTKSPAKP
jgi:hypothetical protein